MRRASVVVLAAFSLVTACGAEPIHAERVGHRVEADQQRLDEEKRTVAVHVELAPPKAKAIGMGKMASKAGPMGAEGACRIGARKPCFTQTEWASAPQVPTMRRSDGDDEPKPRVRRPMPMMVCVATEEGPIWEKDTCGTPLVIAFGDAPIEFTRVDVDFSLQGTARTEWVSAATPWLALDRDGSGCIESEHELFAGFKKLALLDANGDGVLDRRDPAFGELVLWADRNQDKRCTPDEISKLTLDMIPLQAVTVPWTGRSIEGEIATLPGRAGRVSDVFLAPL